MIPKDAVNSVAKHNFELNYDEVTWAELADDIKAGWLEEAQAQCEAAAPFLRAHALEDAADEFSARLPDGTSNGRAYNSYRVAELLRARAVTERGES